MPTKLSQMDSVLTIFTMQPNVSAPNFRSSSVTTVVTTDTKPHTASAPQGVGNVERSTIHVIVIVPRSIVFNAMEIMKHGILGAL